MINTIQKFFRGTTTNTSENLSNDKQNTKELELIPTAKKVQEAIADNEWVDLTEEEIKESENLDPTIPLKNSVKELKSKFKLFESQNRNGVIHHAPEMINLAEKINTTLDKLKAQEKKLNLRSTVTDEQYMCFIPRL